MPSANPAALPQTCYPAVWLYPGQALYAGPGLGLQPHSGSVWCLAVGVDAPLTVTVATRRIVARSVLVPPRLTHHLAVDGRLVSCYLDPVSERTRSCRRQFTEFHHQVGVHHHAQPELVTVPPDDAAATRWLAAAAPVAMNAIDARIGLVAKQIRDDPATQTPARELAASAGLSESRFLHLFRQETGSSLRRYRLWCRLIRAGAELAAGHNLTTAAAEAGFASPSHLADRFKTTFGLSATRLLATGLTIRTS
ncbi:AraC family transcriptional regulator [Mycolicibacterium canariasense]|uniref:AraC family transcriptional regulator n=1 Tax=Mycolicibacterium canariasense TaxID=228230 RepID=A0A100WCY7_MYCCR|nr:AraC family transcriptional regulator [Mycolicibacterium canariasense]MCV7209001.1 helix-turn-helix transcriptional regulator [Mycolicibacterium canariasense]ORV01965.1 transcriptional regulator [Mycolicibacterium canariasense]GAS96224.1 AraC family transcriptional regulator [Mycolicibacterium canariasense]